MHHPTRPRAARLALITLLVLAGSVTAKPWWTRDTGSNEGDFLAPDQAFQPSARIEGNVLRVRWVIADGYYLYRHKFTIAAESPDLAVSAPSFPEGITKTDPYLGTQQVYYQQVEATAAFSRFDGGAHPLQIKVTYQGCADAGLCYLPMTKVLYPTAGPATGTMPAGANANASPSPSPFAHAAAAGNPARRWEGWAILGGAAAFMLAGLLLRKGRTLSTPA